MAQIQKAAQPAFTPVAGSILRRSPASLSPAKAAPPVVRDVLDSPGQPLDSATRAFMEPRFGHDFSRVRVHTDAKAAESARAVNALAYTVGQDVVFGHGEYAPGTRAGRRLIAHEIAHSVQQRLAEGQVLSGCQPMDGPALTPVSRMKLARWAIRGNEATVSRQGDTLWGLAQQITGHGIDWSCIWPTETRSDLTWGDDYERHIQPGDKFDISNLTKTEGPSGTLTFYSAGDEFLEAMRALYGGSNVFDLEAQIGNLANDGTTPIRSLTVCGHSGGGEIWGGGSRFSPSDHSPEEPRPCGARAHSKHGPHRSWFTRNAVVRFVGCSSATVAGGFAEAFLRKGAVAMGTESFLCGWLTSPSFRYVTAQEPPCDRPKRPLYFRGTSLNSAPRLWSEKKGRL